MVEAVTEVEPEWDAQQQAWMLALALLEEHTCNGCGGLLGETTRAEAEDGYDVGKAIRCHRCTALAEAAHVYRDNPHPEALRFPVVREFRPPAAPAGVVDHDEHDLPLTPSPALAHLLT